MAFAELAQSFEGIACVGFPRKPAAAHRLLRLVSQGCPAAQITAITIQPDEALLSRCRKNWRDRCGGTPWQLKPLWADHRDA